MSRALRSYLEPVSKVKSVLIQVKVDEDLSNHFKKICEKNRWKMTDVIRAGIQKVIDDESEKPKAEGTFQLRKINFDPNSNPSNWK